MNKSQIQGGGADNFRVPGCSPTQILAGFSSSFSHHCRNSPIKWENFDKVDEKIIQPFPALSELCKSILCCRHLNSLSAENDNDDDNDNDNDK